ncbi:uncharacterized protein LOC143250230 [Tachypleus tridentatus]|uniref:uncharacterized protein LOC143250230 n=1 Tax=Tachypleus tridentatus TaxID=6853 RepID=UPI003FD22397
MKQIRQEENESQMVLESFKFMSLWLKCMGACPLQNARLLTPADHWITSILTFHVVPVTTIVLTILRSLMLWSRLPTDHGVKDVIRVLVYLTGALSCSATYVTLLVRRAQLYKLLQECKAVENIVSVTQAKPKRLKRIAICFVLASLLLALAAAGHCLGSDYQLVLISSRTTIINFKLLLIIIEDCLWRFLISAQYITITAYMVFFSKALGFFYNSLNVLLKQALKKKYPVLHLPTKLEHLRLLHFRLNQMVELMKKMVSPALMLDIILSTLTSCFVIYGSVALSEPALAVWCIVLVIRVSLMCFFIGGMSDEASETFKIIHDTPLGDFSEDTIVQLQMFLAKFEGENRSMLSDSQYMEVNRRLFVTVIGVIVAYIVVIVQLL